MPGPPPKPAAQRQRRNKTTTAATLQAAPATKVALPAYRVSALTCQHCDLAAWEHTRHHFEKARRAGIDLSVHDYAPRELAWRPGTGDWWDVIWASPMAEEWVAADVPGLLALAVLVDEFWTTGDRGIHAEMRTASREFGLSPLSRRQLQWEIRKVESARKPEAQPPSRRGKPTFAVLTGKSA